jgi:hypothetical protein
LIYSPEEKDENRRGEKKTGEERRGEDKRRQEKRRTYKYYLFGMMMTVHKHKSIFYIYRHVISFYWECFPFTSQHSYKLLQS